MNYFYCIPEKVQNLLPDIEEKPPEISGFCIDYLKEILSIISIHIKKDNQGANLMITYLRKIVPQADKYINYLIKAGIVERDQSYKVGQKSYTYKFTPAYESKYSTSLLTNPKLIRRIEKQQRHLKKRNSKKYPNQNKFIRNMTIDKKALDFINTNLSNEILKQNYSLGSVTAILNGEISYSVDNTSGRYHSNLTNLPSELRQFININGKHLANIDIKNSQPYLSTLLLTDPGKIAKHAKSKNLSMLLETLQGIEALDIKLYVSLVISGKLYEYLWEVFKENGLHFETRNEVKKQMFIILFGRNEIWNKQREVFNIVFPNVYERFCQIKGHSNEDNRFENYKRLAIILQRIESFLILDIILGCINIEHPGTITVTIHDSIMTSIMTNEVSKVKKIMERELSEYVGFKPMLKVEKSTSNYNIEDIEDIKGAYKEGYQYDVRNPVYN